MVLYEEKYFVELGLVFFIVMLLVSVIFNITIFANISLFLENPPICIFIDLLMIFGMLLLLAQTRFILRIGEGKLSFGFPPFMPKIPLKEIEKISFIGDGIKLPVRAGISWSFYGGISYLTGQGDVVKVKSQGRDVYFFSVKNPQEVERILSGLIGKNKVYSDSSQK
ncbi:MAG: hypothetical protein AMQ22_02183 [Candidatus Methanofastidiosum methylothiophilum]|uniref:Bacterial Pleckstrin homology domain-containing protein n=1 Tax=Candidatus Methanofastidiosum methylothiophilum TaxID=1705564 RepID=A0A150ILI8_9EURY|nr:MAG: hypothetical protein AMQ22_02183 [Candidatus Methanofastidiosum methylthiophilus]